MAGEAVDLMPLLAGEPCLPGSWHTRDECSQSTVSSKRKTPSVGREIESATTVSLAMHALIGAVASNVKTRGGATANAAQLSGRM
eukprot:1512297-Pleurochrysis_carterae.AAC.2